MALYTLWFRLKGITRALDFQHMRKSNAELPTHLKNGDGLPSKFSDVCALVPKTPRYKIVAYSINSFGGFYRLVHAYYVSLLGDDPSRLQGLMKSRSRAPASGFEDGRLVESMLVYREYLPIEQMAAFSGTLLQLVQENSDAYTMVRFHNVVQFSSDRFSEPLVFSSIDTR
jgi:hypothetical protein